MSERLDAPEGAATRASSPAQEINLRNRGLALLLSWLLPGAGHFYQRRYFKAAIFALSIWTLLIAGLEMGSYRAPLTENGPEHLFFARDVYCSWRPGDKRLYFIPQAFVGVVAIPAYLQSRNPVDATEEFWSTAFAPPRLPSEERRAAQPTGDEIVMHLGSWFDLGSLYTLVAGLLNLMAIFDAFAGPVLPEDSGKEDKSKQAPKQNANAPV
ncbi:MAG: hypothetical protein Q4G03_05135 [Planctomycetia bacterium]|nr:hypothetical protein [Planctomycetia bacterium]